RIKELWGLIMSGKLVQRGDESEHIARDLKSEIENEVFAEWETVKKGKSEKGLRRRDREDTHQRRSSNELVRSLVELAGLQRDEINYLRLGHTIYKWANTHARKELDAIRAKLFQPVLARAAELKPKQAYEKLMRSTGPRDEIGLIEYEFGGQAQAR